MRRSTAPAPGALATPDPGGVVAPGLGHRPGLDGLRALAVLAVLGYHTGVLRSGWIGVDVFFALSGYLITGLLLAELAANGRIDLRRFWVRRARRLLPGVVLLLAFVVLLGQLRVPEWSAPELSDVLGTITYSSNWLRIFSKQSYWDLFRTPGPFEHVWSLAIEEQFYVIWPVVVAVVGRRGRPSLLHVTVFLLVLTSGLQIGLGLAGASNERLYVGTDTRAPAFLLGALLVLWADRGGRPAPWATYAMPVGLAWLLAACVLLDGTSDWTYRGVLLAVSALGAGTVLSAARLPQGTRVADILASVPLQQLGRWSYGTYLFHWPVAVALRGQEMLGIQRFVLVGGISITLAAFSYEGLEHPIRRAGLPVRFRLPAVALSGTILIVACTTVAGPTGRALDAATRAELMAPLSGPSETIDPRPTDRPATPATPSSARNRASIRRPRGRNPSSRRRRCQKGSSRRPITNRAGSQSARSRSRRHPSKPPRRTPSPEDGCGCWSSATRCPSSSTPPSPTWPPTEGSTPRSALRRGVPRASARATNSATTTGTCAATSRARWPATWSPSPQTWCSCTTGSPHPT
ncbi:MAG: acyltransferase [Ilumatobacteraceae bacterium]